MRVRPAAFGLLVLLTLASGAGGEEAGQIPLSKLMAQSSPQSPAPSPTASQAPVLPGSQRQGSSASRGHTSATAETRRLPEYSTTKQTITEIGRTRSFTATAGSLRLFNESGEPQADIAFSSFLLVGSVLCCWSVSFFFFGGL